MGVPTTVHERDRWIQAALEDDGLTPVRLTVDKEWLDDHDAAELQDIAPTLADELADQLEEREG